MQWFDGTVVVLTNVEWRVARQGNDDVMMMMMMVLLARHCHCCCCCCGWYGSGQQHHVDPIVIYNTTRHRVSPHSSSRRMNLEVVFALVPADERDKHSTNTTKDGHQRHVPIDLTNPDPIMMKWRRRRISSLCSVRRW